MRIHYFRNILRGTYRWLWLLYISAIIPAHAEEKCISLLEPPTSPAYSGILDDIKRGLESSSQLPIKTHTLHQEYNAEAVISALCDLVIGIGHTGMLLGENLRRPAVSGAVFIPPGTTTPHPVFSLIPDPKELFLRLQFFAPNIKKVAVVYSEKYSATLIDTAEQQAKTLGLELVPLKTTSLKESMRLYKELFNETNADTALWILQDPLTIDNNVILTFLLELSWDKNIVMFSSQALLAKHGALFSVYPDNIALGKRLYAALMEQAQENNPKNSPTVILLQDLFTAFNTRTASHLGIQYKRGKYVDQTFPR